MASIAPTCPACQCRPADDFEAFFRHAYDWAYIHKLMGMDDAEQFAHWFAWRYKDEDEADIPSYRFALTVWKAHNA